MKTDYANETQAETKRDRNSVPDCRVVSTKHTQKRHVQITTLLNNSGHLTDKKIAEIVGCSTKTVERVRKKNQPALEEIKDKLEQYRACLNEHLPVEYRAMRLKELASQNSQLMVALRAIERADIVDGLGRPTEADEPVEHRPMFNLPPGTKVALTIETSPTHQARTIDVDAIVENESE